MISLHGCEWLLKAAARDQELSASLWAGLVTGIPTKAGDRADLVEPTLGVNGYARIQLNRNNVDWPTEGIVGNERFVETKDLIWLPVGGNYDQEIDRVALFFTQNNTAGPALVDKYFGVSVPLPAPITLGPATPLAARTFRFRIYA